MALKIYLIRHGETDFNKQNKEWGQPNETALNDWGIEQSEKLAQRLKEIKFEKLFSSDLKRAIQTAEIVSKAIEIPIIKDERLREYDPGEVDPSSEKWIEEYKRLLNSRMSKYEIRPFGGENIWDLIKRVKSFLGNLKKEKGTIAIISHSGVNSALINLSQGKEKENFIGIKQDNTCINILGYTNGKWNLVKINDSSHISDLVQEITLYKNQQEIKQITKDYVLEKLSEFCNHIIFKGGIVNGKIGYYNRPYKRYKGTPIEIIVNFKEHFLVPKDWKISELKNGITKYEIGNVKINDLKHKVNVILSSKEVIKYANIERIK